MNIRKDSDNWLFQNNTKEEIKEWANSLHYFYFFRQYEDCGFGPDDRFEASFSYRSKEHLLNTMEKLGMQINVLPPDTPRPVAGVPYPTEEFCKFKESIHGFPDLEQPGNTKINSYSCHIYVDESTINISVPDTQEHKDLTAKEFAICKQLEIFFDKLSLHHQKNYGIEEDAGCVCRNRYQELFK